MTSYQDRGTKPTVGIFRGFDHIEFYVSNAKQIADWYVLRFGFQHWAYKGLETGSKDFASWVVKQGKILLVFTSPLTPDEGEKTAYIARRGDSVKDVAFQVVDCEALHAKAVSRGAESVRNPQRLTDENGTVIVASVKTYGNCTHTFVQRDGYKGRFMPGFVSVEQQGALETMLPPPGLEFIDHVVGNQPDNEMDTAASWYINNLDFHRFWSVDDTQIHTEYSSLRSVVMADYDRTVKMPINEPADGNRISQIQEFVNYHGGPGVQHIALNTSDILSAIANLKKRGVKFLQIPDTYYELLKKRLAKSPVKVKEDIDKIQELGILVDFDDKGYLLQLFTKPIEDRPTLFFEVIQRANNEGFGVGNFKALFAAIERAQEKRSAGAVQSKL